MFFSLNSVVLGVILFAVILGAAALGVFIGRRHRHRREELREPFGALQGALLGVVGLVLAFGLALAVGRYESRRAVVVEDANAIGTTWLRAQTLPEPTRSRSLVLIRALVRRLHHRTELAGPMVGGPERWLRGRRLGHPVDVVGAVGQVMSVR